MTFKKLPFGIFYGWLVVAAAFVITFVGFGSAYTFSSFFESLQHEFGASRGSVSLVFSLAGFLYFALGIVSAPLSDRYGVKVLSAAGMILVGSGLILAGRAQSIMQVYAAYSVGIGFGIGSAYVPALGAVQRWFVIRRGFASGLAVSGIGVGTLLLPPFATWLISHIGWRSAYTTLGIVTISLGILAALLMEDDPAKRGLQPDGGHRTPVSQAHSPQSGLSVGQAIRTRRFIELYLASLIGALGVFVPFVHLAPYAIDHDASAATAVWLLGAIGIGSTAGRFFLGGIADKMGRERFLVAMYIGMAASFAIWAVSSSVYPLALFAIVFGLFYGGWVAILPAVVADMFGGRQAGRIIGVLYTSVAVGALIGPSAAGFAYDVSQSYLIPIAASVVLNVIAAIITVMAAYRPAASKAD
ncbi:MFS transporter [Bordetella genomosp. 4]|uniref:MFS transporter n=1 Tax=Bordetella genomosp. 4 TaxID=463044 RepID=UPI000B9DF0DD|nr:MFS transporter [Bordetella genomosp. 4]OZI52659.1 MFS transporter [Bordetella genomosp. 4]